MKAPIVYNVTPKTIFDMLYRNRYTIRSWQIIELDDGIILHDTTCNVVFLTIKSESLSKRLYNLANRVKNLKYIKNGN